MELLLTNDDGIEAPGLLALHQAAAQWGGHSVLVVAPEECHSGGGHRVTTHKDLGVRAHAHGWHAVDGTPADCVRVALHALDQKPEWVLSGINAGGNLGADVYLSGTVAAAREATLCGVKGVAFSQYLHKANQIDWERASRWAAMVLPWLAGERLDPGEFWNVNFPSLPAGAGDPEIVLCDHLGSPLHVAFEPVEGGFRYSGNYHARDRKPGSDVDTCFSGAIAISRVRL